MKPGDLGLSEFESYRVDPVTYRPVQEQIIEFAVRASKRFVGICAPTGIGKTLGAVSIAKLLQMQNKQTIILSATKGVMDQYQRFEKYGVVDVRGKNNYQCSEWPVMDCEDGRRVGCGAIEDKSCTYRAKVSQANAASIVSTNYDFWLSNSRARTATNYGPPYCLILDEAHEAVEKLNKNLEFRVYEREVKEFEWTMGSGVDFTTWQTLARENKGQVHADVEMQKIIVAASIRSHTLKPEQMQVLERLENLERKLESILEARPEDWVIEESIGNKWGRHWDFNVISPGKYAESRLFNGVEKIVLMSATLTRKTMKLLGISQEESVFQEWPRIFSAARQPIYSIPAVRADGKVVRVDNKITEADLKLWVERIDEIIDGRMDRKGIIQTVSYKRQAFLMEHSRHKARMIGNTQDPESMNAEGIAEEFKKSGAGKILVSPSFGTGWDFPYQECEYVIVCKVPFKPTQSKAQKAREQFDSEYAPYMAMTDLVQSTGRGMRAIDDQCEVFCVDGHLGWFLGKYGHLAPGWFSKAVRRVSGVPVPLPRLSERGTYEQRRERSG